MKDKERLYRMELKVWTEMSAEDRRPQDIIFVMENSTSMACLAEAPDEDNTVYRAGTPSLHKISASQVLYTEVEGEYVPVGLEGNQWRLMTGRADDGTLSGKVVGSRDPQQGDIFTQDVFDKSDCPTRMEQAKEAVAELIQQTAEFLPGSRVGLIIFGNSVYSADIRELTEYGTQPLLEEVGSCETVFEEGCRYAEALSKAQEMRKELWKSRENPCSLVSICSGSCESESIDRSAVTPAEQTMQELKEQGVKSHVMLMGSCADAPDYWANMCSAPLESHYRECFQGQLMDEMRALFRHIADSTAVNVVQALDPRFQLTEKERIRLKQKDVSVFQKENGETLVVWQAELPCKEENPWKTELEVEAKKDFPGGNNVAFDGEESGIYWGETLISRFSGIEINVPTKITLRDVQEDVFLGEKVKTTFSGATVEERLLENQPPNWYGKGKTGTISYSWKREDGTAIGSLRQLSEIRPIEDQKFLFTVTYTPGSQGNNAVGNPVQQTCNTGCYSVHVVSGTVIVKALTEKPAEKGGMPVFSLEKDNTVFYRTASIISSEKGKTVLSAEFSELPFGKYRLRQINPFYSKADRECWIGICSKDDTLSLDRNLCEVETKLTAISDADEWNYSVETHGEIFRVEFER